MSPAMVDETGRRYERLVVVGRAPSGADGKVQWLCRCDCGSVVPVRGTNLRSGMATSCGCRQREVAASLKLSHGRARSGRRHEMYMMWTHQRQRCRNPANAKYADYGGRGISFSEAWDEFDVWLTYVQGLAHCGEPGRTLDRIDNDGDYEPGNLRWATNSEQALNRRRKRTARSANAGVSWDGTARKWRARDKQRRHVGMFASEQEAAEAVERANG